MEKGTIAYYAYYFTDHGVHLKWLFVPIALRGKGIGKMMMEHFFNGFEGRYILSEMTVTCRKYNRKALNLYKKFGFKKYSESEDGKYVHLKKEM